MIVNDEGICKNCERFCLWNHERHDGICTKIYGTADFPDGLELDRYDDEIVLQCPYWKLKEKRR